jgi:RHS repeat-associated protein
VLYYGYDNAGNMTSDGHKDLTVAYNALNLPDVFTFANVTPNNKIEIVYNAAGEKLEKQVYTGATLSTHKRYLMGIEYTGTTLEAIYHAEGRIVPIGGGVFRYEYTLKDHLGNSRVMFAANGSAIQLLQENHHYPFGMEMKGAWIAQSGTENGYTYNGKELDKDWGLNWIDYGRRRYDPAIGRWNGVDSKAELYQPYSPYCYVVNRPINAIDPDGDLVIFINGNHFAGSKGPGEPYWNKYGTSWYARGHQGNNFYGLNRPRLGVGVAVDFDGDVMDHLNDHNPMYVDGSLGGGAPFSSSMNDYATVRTFNGFLQGYSAAKDIIKKISDKDGNIVETIKVITHSMGAAFAKGFITGILKYVNDNEIKGVLIAFEADFAPFQPQRQSAVPGVPTFQFSNKYDGTANRKMLGSYYVPIRGAEKATENDDPNKHHMIWDFHEQIVNLPTGDYEVVNGKIVPKDKNKK